MSEILLICFFILITGACIGSFLNVVALRAISKESIIFPSSKCPHCNSKIKWYDNIPVLSYFLTFKGKCRNCGEKVSIQYPIVEAVTAVLFLCVYIAFGTGFKSLLLLILLCISIVIIITDIKKEEIYDIHSWILIITAIIYSLYVNGIENYSIPAFGLIAGVLVMEITAKAAYYLIKKDDKKEKDNETEEQTENKEEPVQAEAETDNNDFQGNKENEEIDINEYVNKNKRAFGEADTYLAAASGALLGWKYLLAAVAFAIILQAVCILPQFLSGLYKQKEYRLITSLSAFILIALIYWILSNIFTLNLFLIFAIIITLIFFAIDTITGLKRITLNNGFSAIPFGPALLFSTFLILFWGPYIVGFIKKYIFMVMS